MKQEMLVLWDFLELLKESMSDLTGEYSFYHSWLSETDSYYSGITKGKPPRKHKEKQSDLYAKIQSNSSLKTITIEHIPLETARILEAYCIKYSSIYIGLHSVGDTTIKPGKALNKRRELKWENLIPKQIIDGNYIRRLIKRQTNRNSGKGIFCYKRIRETFYRRNV